jgi:hypothetical protein
MPPPSDPADPYGLHRPTMDDARETVERVHGGDGPHVWAGLLKTAGLTGRETGSEDFERLLRAMAAADPISQLCAQALHIRLVSHTQLAAAHKITRSSP